jgi:hypothetical protein
MDLVYIPTAHVRPDLLLRPAYILAICLGVLAGMGAVASAGEGGLASEQVGRIVFDLPAQPLPKALAAFSRETGFEIIADAREAHGRTSSPVIGAMQPHEALLTLLAGTGLAIRDYAPGNVRLVAPAPSALEPEFSPANSRHAPYFAAVQRAILRAVCHADATWPGPYRLAIKLWVAPSGAVSRVKLLDTTGDGGRDMALNAALGQVDVGSAPPADFQQPITLVILPRPVRSSDDCDDADTGARHASN